MSMNASLDVANTTAKHVAGGGGETSVKRLTFTIIACIMGLLIITFNSAIIYVYRKMDSLKTFSNYLLANLALSDLSTGLVTIPLVVIASNIPFQKSLIPFYFVAHALNTSAIYVIVLNMTLVVLERFFNLCHPYLYDNLRKLRCKRVMCTIPWLLVTILAAAPATWHYKVILGEGEENAETREIDLIYSYFTTFLCFVLPTFLIAFSIASMCYSIFNVLRRDRCVSAKRKLQSGIKMVIIFMLMFVTMMICWLPWAIIRILIDSGMNWDLSEELKDTLFFMRCLSSLVSPLLYAIIKRDFRRAIRRLVQIRTANLPEIRLRPIFTKGQKNDRPSKSILMATLGSKSTSSNSTAVMVVSQCTRHSEVGDGSSVI